MENKKTNRANIEKMRWKGFLLGTIIVFSVFFVALEYTSNSFSDETIKHIDLKKHLVVKDMLPAINQDDLDDKITDEKLKREDLLNVKRSEKPNKVEPKEAGKLDRNDATTASPVISDKLVTGAVSNNVANLNEEIQKDKEEKYKLSDEKNLKDEERIEEKIKAKVLSIPPTPPNGWGNFMKWLTQNIKYPQSLSSKKGKIEVVLLLVIDTNGSVSEVKVKETSDTHIIESILSVVKDMQKWKPGIENNKPCKANIEIPIVFNNE